MCVRQYVAVTARTRHPCIVPTSTHQSCPRSSNPSHLESSSHAHSAPIRTMQTVSASSPSAAKRDSTVVLPYLHLLNYDGCLALLLSLPLSPSSWQLSAANSCPVLS
jgi:hypothetical protein